MKQICPKCHREVLVRKDGTFARHVAVQSGRGRNEECRNSYAPAAKRK